jgi:hypothetical protein
MKLTREELLLTYLCIGEYINLLKAGKTTLQPEPRDVDVVLTLIEDELLHPEPREKTDEEDDYEDCADEEECNPSGLEGTEAGEEEEEASHPGDCEEDCCEEESTPGTTEVLTTSKLEELPDLNCAVIDECSDVFNLSVGDHVRVEMVDVGDIEVTLVNSDEEYSYDNMCPNTLMRTGRTLTIEEGGQSMVLMLKKFPKAWTRTLAVGQTYTIVEDEETE